MATASRFYVVLMQDRTKRLIDAANPAQAVRHVAKKLILCVSLASARDVADLLGEKVEIEKATGEPQ